MKDGVMELAKRNDHGDIKKGGDNDQIEALEESLYQIQESMKIENGYNTTLSNQVENFIHKVEKMKEVNEGGLLLRDEKVLLIAACKTITRHN